MTLATHEERVSSIARRITLAAIDVLTHDITEEQHDAIVCSALEEADFWNITDEVLARAAA